ncbi:hypothetical protein C8R45DRAFT_205035 [Mycena sanguinolenta]|nr:hypothetical protein C8R45DRAFT_205035 [Mycena sanguinolenta]
MIKLDWPLGQERIDLEEKPIQIFNVAPQLRELYLKYAPASLFAIPWENLTVFDGKGISCREYVDVLRWAPSLIASTLINHIIPAITHPNLKFFRVLSFDDAIALFQFLTFSVLEDLDILVDLVDDGDLPQFISRSSPSLLSLSSLLDVIPLEPLFGMFALTSLKLSAPSSAYLVEFFRHFDRTKNSTFLPQLQELVFRNCPPFVDAVLVDALSSRSTAAQGSGPILRSFRQNWLDCPHRGADFESIIEGYRDAFAELTKGGMEIFLGDFYL